MAVHPRLPGHGPSPQEPLSSLGSPTCSPVAAPGSAQPVCRSAVEGARSSTAGVGGACPAAWSPSGLPTGWGPASEACRLGGAPRARRGERLGCLWTGDAPQHVGRHLGSSDDARDSGAEMQAQPQRPSSRPWTAAAVNPELLGGGMVGEPPAGCQHPPPSQPAPGGHGDGLQVLAAGGRRAVGVPRSSGAHVSSGGVGAARAPAGGHPAEQQLCAPLGPTRRHRPPRPR